MDEKFLDLRGQSRYMLVRIVGGRFLVQAAVPVALTGLVALVLLELNGVIPDRAQVIVLALPVAAVTWWFGVRTGFVAVLVGAVGAAFLLVPPIGMWVPPNGGDLIATTIFTAIALATVAVIGQLRRSREELVAQNLRLAEIVAEKSRLEALRDGFAAMLAHELRTPLTVILGDARVLLTSAAADSDRHASADLVADIEQEASRLHQLVEDLLVVSRGVGELQVTVEPVMLPHVLAAAASYAAHRNPRLTVSVDAADDLPAVDADPVLCQQVLANLISNAAKYAGPAAVVRLAAWAEGGAVAIRCEDDGPGFPQAAIAHVFDPFYRVPGSERVASGAGVGLYVVRQLVTAMGGQVQATNAHAGGHAVVTIWLPVTAEPDVGARRSNRAGDLDLSPRDPATNSGGEASAAEPAIRGEADHGGDANWRTGTQWITPSANDPRRS